MAEDHRVAIYQDLHGDQLAREEVQNRESANRILKIVLEYVQPRSVLDVGCGLGTWLSEAQKLGASEILGIEGNWLDPTRLKIDPTAVRILDLEHGFSLGRRFDLAICLEVGEHLSSASAGPLVAALAMHTDIVLFSAAIPFQGGHHHVNEQFPDYWAEFFNRHEFRAIDLLRPRIWNDRAIHWWLRQNALIFAHDRAIAANSGLKREFEVPRPLCLVHPDLYIGRNRMANEAMADCQKLIEILGQGGTFKVTRLPNGGYSLSRVE